VCTCVWLVQHDALLTSARCTIDVDDDATTIAQTVLSSVSTASSIRHVHSRQSLAAVVEKAKAKAKALQSSKLETIAE
jgi:hypothetical protein